MPEPYAILPDEGLAELLKQQIKYAIAGVMNLQLMLFVDPEEIDRTVVFADLTPATFNGYSEVTLDRADWGDPVVTDGVGVSEWSPGPITWTNNGPPQTVRGAAYYDPASSKLRKVDVFFPAAVVGSGEQLQYLPRWTFLSQTQEPPA